MYIYGVLISSSKLLDMAAMAPTAIDGRGGGARIYQGQGRKGKDRGQFKGRGQPRDRGQTKGRGQPKDRGQPKGIIFRTSITNGHEHKEITGTITITVTRANNHHLTPRHPFSNSNSKKEHMGLSKNCKKDSPCKIHVHTRAFERSIYENLNFHW